MSKKTIFIEGLGLVDGHFSGIGQYILGILKGLDSIIDEKKHSHQPYPALKVIIPYDSVNRFRSFGFKHIDYTVFPLPFRIMSGLWYRGKMPPIDLWCGHGTYIFPRFVSMPLMFSKSALVIYDISFELYRQYSDEKNAEFLSAAVKRSLDKSEKVITISQNARNEIVDFYKVKPKDVAVATPATDPHLFYRRSDTQIENAKRKYKIEGNYILALSNLEPRKNLQTLVDAYCALPAETRDKYSLLLVGVSGWKIDQLFDHIIDKVKQGYKIIRPSHYVDDNDKPAIISGASLLVYPSHYEGFGMPPLEALACGVPVITADNSSLPEVVGGVGEMIKSTDTDGFAKSIEHHLKSKDTAARMITEGPKRAREFSWKESAQVFLDIAEEIS